MRNTKSLNVALSVCAIVVAAMIFIYGMRYGSNGSTSMFGFVPGEDGKINGIIRWQTATFMLIMLIIGFLLMTVKIVYCSVMNLRDNGPEGYTLGGIILDSVNLISIIMMVSLYIVVACSKGLPDQSAAEALGNNMTLIGYIAMPLAVLSAICGGYLTKRCYGK